MNGDTREWRIVQSGSLRFTVEGREPVVATKGPALRKKAASSG